MGKIGTWDLKGLTFSTVLTLVKFPIFPCIVIYSYKRMIYSIQPNFEKEIVAKTGFY